jgi:hypothetical protein
MARVYYMGRKGELEEEEGKEGWRRRCVTSTHVSPYLNVQGIVQSYSN